MNVSRQAISRWELGVTMPSTDNLKYLSALYGVTLDSLLDETKSPEIEPAKSEEANATPCSPPKHSLALKLSVLFFLILLSVIAIIIVTQHKNDSTEIVLYEELDMEDANTIPKTSFTLDW